MPLRLIDQVCDPDDAANADGWFSDAMTAVLLDGATPKARAPLTGHVNDTVWLVRRFVELWQRAELGSADAAERAELARVALGEEYSALSAGAAAAESPFACLTIVQAAGAGLELFNMGDQTVLLRAEDGSVSRFGESAVRQLDGEAIAGLRRALAEGITPHAERLRRIEAVLAANQARRNVLPGYEVLEPGVSCLGRFERLSCAPPAARSVLMMSDGFYRLVDTFERYTDASLFDAVERRGLRALLAELRAIELADAECVRHPRFKAHDDATALWLAID